MTAEQHAASRPGYVFCICPDGRLSRNAVDAYLAASPPPPSGGGLAPVAGAWVCRSFWGDEELPAAFWEALTLQGLFATPQAIVLRNAHLLPAETWRRLNAALSTASALTWPFLCLEGSWEKNQPKIPAHIKKLRCLDFAEKRKWIWQQPGLDARGIRQHVTEAAKRLGVRFAPGALDALTASLPPDAATIENELTKLALLCDDGQITTAHTAWIDHAPAFDIFAFLRQVQSGNAAAMWKTLLREERQSDDLIFPLLGLLQREARLLWQLRAGESPQMHPSSAAAKKDLAVRLGFTGLADLWDAMHTAELAIKSGARTPAQALDALLGALTHIFTPSRH